MLGAGQDVPRLVAGASQNLSDPSRIPFPPHPLLLVLCDLPDLSGTLNLPRTLETEAGESSRAGRFEGLA